uniref:Uncharacterized protein n=1 Tax=Arundo donax TaxID=35708 RepID=A0A0A9AEE6_ARUDO
MLTRQIPNSCVFMIHPSLECSLSQPQ